MNNARKTVNVALAGIVLERLGPLGFVTAGRPHLYTGDEENPEVKLPAVSIEWLDGDAPGRAPESRRRLAQLDVLVGNQDTSKAEAACEALLDGLGIRFGSKPVGTLPKLDYSQGAPGVPLGTTLSLRTLAGKGWSRRDPPQRQARRYVLTLEVDYIPG